MRVHPDAEAEADGTFEWYWTRSERAALRFDAELRDAYSTLRRSPNGCVQYLRGTRRVLLNRHPYFVVFRELPRKIQIELWRTPSVAPATGLSASKEPLREQNFY